jgi:GT2 family glycosyltransferase
MEPSTPLTMHHAAIPLAAPCSWKQTGGSASRGHHLCLSVVIPTYRRPALLGRCLSALCRQTMDSSRYEIIVVDNAPSQDARETVASLANAGAPHATPAIRYIAAGERRGPAAARNRGWRSAEADLIAFTDDDCVPLSRWLEEGWNTFRTPGISGAWGQIIVPVPLRPTDHELNTKGLEAAPCATANCFYAKSALAAAGGFDERFTAAWREDSDLEFTLRERGFRIIPCSRASVVHPARQAPWGISLGQQRNDVFNALLYKKHPAYYRALLPVRAPWHYYASVVALLVMIVAAGAQAWFWAFMIFLMWSGLALRFCLLRLRHTARAMAHVLEMGITSALIPPLALFWRLRGAIRYRVLWW